MGILGDILGPIFSYKGTVDTNEANRDIASANNVFNAEQAGLARDFNAGQAQINRDWVMDASNTQYQRATADMKAAGLNPMLAYSQGGAGNVAGSQASGPAASSSGNPTMQNPITPAISSALQIALNEATVDRTKAEADKARAEEKEIVWRTPNHPLTGDNIKTDTDLKRTMIGVGETQGLLNVSNAKHADAQAKLAGQMYSQAIESTKLIMAQTSHEKAKQAATEAGAHLTNAQELYTRGQINIQQFTQAIEKAKSMIEENMVQGSAEEQKFQAVWGQVTRIIKGLNPLSGVLK